MDRKRLMWQCRRGMRELDLMLINFVNNRYDQLTEADKALFHDLLKENDQNLFDWLTGKKVPENSHQKQVVKMIRENQ